MKDNIYIYNYYVNIYYLFHIMLNFGNLCSKNKIEKKIIKVIKIIVIIITITKKNYVNNKIP